MNDHGERAAPRPPVTSQGGPRHAPDLPSGIADCLLSPSSPLEAYRRVLACVTPLVGAAFASVFERERADPRLLRLVCAHNWPQPAARYLAAMRIMAGRGPTGRAAGTNRRVEVPDVFADPALEEWWEPARELGFASMVALPLGDRSGAYGVLSFYFTESGAFDQEDIALLGAVAERLTAAFPPGSAARPREGDRTAEGLSDARSSRGPESR